jgi:hypothetical protein
MYDIGQPNPGKTIEDGTDGVSVSCLVKSDGNFSASISGTDANGKKPVSFSFTGFIADKSGTSDNSAEMTFFSPDTLHLNTLATSPQCTVGPVGVYKPGAMLTDINCALIGSDDDSTSGCAVHGTIAFEYCKTGTESN